MSTGENTELTWRNCSHVSIDGDTLRWEPGRSTHSLLKAYAKGLHRELMAADTDKALKVFVRKWGPLRLREDNEDSLSWYRQKRDVLTATVNLYLAVENGVDLQPALAGLIRVSNYYDQLRGFRLGKPDVKRVIRLIKWHGKAPEKDVEEVCVEFLRNFPFTWGGSLIPDERGVGYPVRASLFINSLSQALWWMFWQDIFLRTPFAFCQNCGRFIQGRRNQRPKYCHARCAKKKADRDYWHRKQSKKTRSTKE